MIKILKDWSGLVALIAIILFLSFGSHSSVKVLGGVTNYDEVDATAIKIGGSSGSRVGPLIWNTCTLIGATQSVPATSTLPFDCAVTGVVAGDIIIPGNATTSKTTTGQWFISGASASSTSGFVTFLVTNYTGIAASPASAGNQAGGFGSSTPYMVAHPVSTVPGL